VRKIFFIIFFSLFLTGSAYAETEGCKQGNCVNGQGTFTYANGNKYVGEYKDGQINGQGTYTYANGNKYVGEWKDNKRNGQGTYTWVSGEFKGNKYVGEWKDNKRNGQGTYTYANGDKYVGELKDNKRNGQGTFTWANGDKYVGELKDGQIKGQGTYTWADGTVKEGLWDNDELLLTKSEIARYEKIYNKCILENLKTQTNEEAIKIIKDACKDKASSPSILDKIFN
jgi:hypothetical protein